MEGRTTFSYAGMRYDQWRHFVCVMPARVARPVKLKPMFSWSAVAQLKAHDQEIVVGDQQEMYKEYAAEQQQNEGASAEMLDEEDDEDDEGDYEDEEEEEDEEEDV